MKLGNWLRKQPRPSVVMADDKKIDVPNNQRAINDLTKTIEALKPSALTAYDAKGQVLRALTLESDDEEKAPPSPEMSDLQLFAKLLAEAYDKGFTKMQPIIDGAMAFVERGGQRLAKAEADNERLRNTVHKQHLQIAELSGQQAPPGSSEESVLTTMLTAALQSGALDKLIPTDAPVQVTPINKAGVKK